jgi:hypothetical protein
MSRPGVSARSDWLCRFDAKGGEASSPWFNSAGRVTMRDLADLHKTPSRTSFLVAYTIGPLMKSDVTEHLDISRLRERIRQANTIHGRYTARAKAERKEYYELLRACRAMLASLSGLGDAH